MGAPGLVSRGWITALDFDFTAQASQTLSPDGLYLIGGFDWHKRNSANDAVAMAITSGTGLVVQPASATEYNASTRTLPLLELPFGQVPALSNLEWASAIRLWVHIAAYNGAANFDNAVFAIDSSTVGASTFMGTRGNGVSNVTMSYQQSLNGNTISGSGFAGGNTLTLNATNNVVVVDVARLDGFVGTVKFGAFGLATGKTWPDPADLQIICGCQAAPAAYNMYAGATTGAFNVPVGMMGLALGAKRDGSATALNVTYGHVRVDYKN
jgi:hypothetical protein